jgi:hypothetical protein
LDGFYDFAFAFFLPKNLSSVALRSSVSSVFVFVQSGSYWRANSMATAIPPITAFASHPTTRNGGVSANLPMTYGFEAVRMRMAIRGAATTPLMIAERDSAAMGLKAKKERRAGHQPRAKDPKDPLCSFPGFPGD